ncbi:MAG: VTT domain-containing protein [Gammaproteobacteria bacterium]|nr:VTT domain-containing protein [Gammaproteobacteria bacterium]
MRQLITLALTLAAIFVSTFILIKATGILTVEDIESALAAASKINPLYVAAIIIALLFADLFIAIPTLTIAILSGYFLGFVLGGISAMSGMLLAGLAGYMLCWLYGPGLLMKIYKNPEKLREMERVFSLHGSMALIICRALPILPEVSCCLAGANRMSFWKFLFYYSIGTIPYAFIASYAGSQSSLSNPKPAIFTAIAISLSLWLAWFIFLRKSKNKQIAKL